MSEFGDGPMVNATAQNGLKWAVRHNNYKHFWAEALSGGPLEGGAEAGSDREKQDCQTYLCAHQLHTL